MRFFRLLSSCALLLAPFPVAVFGTPGVFAEKAVEDAKGRLRRAELLSISQDLRGIYADLAKSDIPDLERSRRLAPIAARYENLLQRFPDDAETLVLYAKFLRDGGDDDGAREYFEKALKLEPSWAVVYQQLAAIAAERGDAEKAFPLMQKAVELEPGQLVYQLQLGELITALRDKLLEVKIFETRAEADCAMQNAFRAARALSPQSADVAIRYAESFYDVEKADWRSALEAWNIVQKMIAVSEAFGTNSAAKNFMRESVNLHRARVYAELGELGHAEAMLRDIADERLVYSRERLRKMIFEKGNNSVIKGK